MSVGSTAAARRLVSPRVFGMLIFVFTEVMFFAALVSALIVIRAGRGGFVPPAGIRLPIEATGINTLVLFLSGVFLYLAGRSWNKSLVLVKANMGRAAICGATFVIFQGYEWTQLLRLGMTMKANIFSACFFLLIGMHALHAVVGIGFIIATLFLATRGKLSRDALGATQVFWYFVVGVWPTLYGLVYF